MTFFSVSTVADRDDNGTTVTFDNATSAMNYREWALGQGFFFVSAIWS